MFDLDSVPWCAHNYMRVLIGFNSNSNHVLVY